MFAARPRLDARVPKGMDKSGNQTIANSDDFTEEVQLTTFTTRSGFSNGPTGNTLVVSGSGLYNIVAKLTWTTSDDERGFRVKRGSTVITSIEPAGNVTVMDLTANSYALTDGEVLTLWAYNGSTTSGNRIISGGTGTFLTITPV